MIMKRELLKNSPVGLKTKTLITYLSKPVYKYFRNLLAKESMGCWLQKISLYKAPRSPIEHLNHEHKYAYNVLNEPSNHLMGIRICVNFVVLNLCTALKVIL